MSAFDQALAKIVAAVSATPFYPQLTGVTVVHDLKGRIRLLLEFPGKLGDQSLDDLPADWSVQKSALQERLSQDLGSYWGGTIWRGRERRDPVFVATADALRSSRQAWQSGAQPPAAWFKVERQFSKSSWTAMGAPPWPIEDGAKPGLVAFYSFKGGVGRTIALSAVALLLARAGQRVVVIDLDLEAPGAAPFLMGSVPLPEDGVVDYLIEWQLNPNSPANLAPLISIQADPALVGTEPIRVLASGRVNASFIEKVARLDFEGYITPARNPLAELLKQIADEYQPSFILLDVRSGLHDLGGLSLNMLSHLNVVFTRDSGQAWAGLETVLAILGEHRAAGHGSELLVVHSMVPKERDPQAHERFLSKSFDLFEKIYFTEADTMPDIQSNEAPYGVEIPFQESLQNAANAASLEPSSDAGGAYVNLTRRIGSLLGRHTI